MSSVVLITGASTGVSLGNADRCNPGIVDRDIDPSRAIKYLLYRSIHGTLVGNI